MAGKLPEGSAACKRPNRADEKLLGTVCAEHIKPALYQRQNRHHGFGAKFAALTDPRTPAPRLVANIRLHMAGESLVDEVDRRAGY